MTSKRAEGAADSSTARPPLMDDVFGYAIGVLFRAYAKGVEAAVADLPGGPRGYFILTAAVRGEAGSQRSLADGMGIDRTVMTYLLDDLEEAGLVERKPDPADRRSRHILATPQGEELWGELSSRVEEVERRLLAGVPETSRQVFLDVLFTLARQADAFERELADRTAADPAGTQRPVRAARRGRGRSRA
ncbi:MarR family winged helix-turn-helix transcriptional regulator [Streptomyces sp. B93]|uniref:MarR family winged helix-turn-helix transcriptional regulator n=1 Tax=Streptomyces sp. B93 TaxID=2824875 RepID=UPI001B3885E7|nr:MarR family transcriptional regulator [Streptomyces sp. B93]MBQ1091928.1 MarR family transcriptional regulator [Streptomyces sp. B93]